MISRTRAGTARRSTALRGHDRGELGATLAIAVTLALAALLLLSAGQLLLIHPGVTGLYGATGQFNQQVQTVKTDVYVLALVVVLPLALLGSSRLVGAILAGPNATSLTTLAAILSGALAGAIILVRLSGSLPWGTGVKAVLAAVVAWAALALPILWRTARGPHWPALHRLSRRGLLWIALAVALSFGVLLCLTSAGSLSPAPLLLGTCLALGVVGAYGRVHLPKLSRSGLVLDLVVLAFLLLAIPDVIVFRTGAAVPNFVYPPGLVQFQQDWLLGPTNQLLGGGALLAGDPTSQYGVGLIYFLAGWFRLAPIGYGTFGFLDGLLTALFYMAGYATLRMAGVRRLLAACTIALGVLALIYNFRYFVGQLPEQGPLRFGLPMLVVLAGVAGTRWPRHYRLCVLAELGALGVSAVWALEAFAYTTVTYLALVAAQSWLRPPGRRRRPLVIGVLLGGAAVVSAHVLFALATLIGSGQLPDWGQYLTLVHELLLGRVSKLTYGFANWSPGLAVYVGAFASAAALVLLVHRRPTLARRHPGLFVALAGCTTYSLALLSYTDNRSSTYLFLYVSLPLLLAAALWLSLVLAPSSALSVPARRGFLAAALSVAVLLFSGAWPAIGSHFSRTALAHAFPGGGLSSALHRLWHPPPIDPRTPEGIRLLDRYMPGNRVLIVFPTVPDLGTEILMRSHRTNFLPIGDAVADSIAPAVWIAGMRAAVATVRAGTRVLTDQTGLRVFARLERGPVDVLRSPVDGGWPELEWILQALERRFRLVVVHRGSDGLIVARLAAR